MQWEWQPLLYKLWSNSWTGHVHVGMAALAVGMAAIELGLATRAVGMASPVVGTVVPQLDWL